MTGTTRCRRVGLEAGREGPDPVARRRRRMTRDEALMEVRRRAGGDLSYVPGPVIMRAVEMVMKEEAE